MIRLILLVLPLNVFALTPAQWDAEIAALNESTDTRNGSVDIRRVMKKCGFNEPNIKLFIKTIKQSDDTTKLDCMKAQKAVVDDEKTQETSKRAQFKSDCLAVKNDSNLPVHLRRAVVKLCRLINQEVK